MGKKTILALSAGHPGQYEALEKDYRIIRLWKERDAEATLSENARDIEVITTFLRPVAASLIDALPHLKLIAVGATGTDHIDVEAAKARGVAVTNTPDVLTQDTADLAMGLILTLMRRIVEGDAFVRAGMWSNQTFPLATSLLDKKLGIVGFGKIGQAVAERAKAFGLDIAYQGPNNKDSACRYFQDINDLATFSDVMLCTCPGGEDTRHLIDYNVLGHLGSKGYLVNVSRGSVVNQEDLLIALQNRTIAGAALDVYDSEPQVNEAFFVMDNVVLTPHIGSATKETRVKMGEIVVANIRNCLNGKSLVTQIC